MLTPSLPLPERPTFTPATLRGRGHGGKSIVATAALLGESEGRLTLSADLLAEAARNARYSEDSWRDVIIVAQSGASALLLPMPDGLKMVGVVSEHEIPAGAPTAIPTVSGVIGAREQIAEGSLLLLDPVRGRVLVEPDATEVAALQAGAHRARFRMGAVHLPATTQSGRTVSVLALIRTSPEVDEALLGGADGLFVPASAEILAPLGEDSGDALSALLKFVEAFGGGDITLSLTVEMFAPTILARIAASSLLRVALPPSDLPLPAADVRFEVEKIVQQETNAGRRSALFGLVALVSDMSDPETASFDEIYLPAESVATMPPEEMFALPPVYALFDNPFDDSLPGFDAVISAGAAGVVVPLSRVPEVKERIREQE